MQLQENMSEGNNAPFLLFEIWMHESGVKTNEATTCLVTLGLLVWFVTTSHGLRWVTCDPLYPHVRVGLGGPVSNVSWKNGETVPSRHNP